MASTHTVRLTPKSPQNKAAASTQDTLFTWTERSASADRQRRSGEIRARDEEHARFLLRQQGIRQMTIRRVKTVKNPRIPLKLVAEFVRQLAVMIQSGVPLGQSLGLIANNMTAGRYRVIRGVVRDIRADVESGLRLSDALRKHPKCFDKLFCNTLAAGEDSGQIEDVLVRLATHIEKILRTRQKVRKALTYPSIVMVVAIAVTVSLLMFVMPTFSDMYKQFDADLPPLTEFLIQASDTLKESGLWILGGVIATIYGLYRLYKADGKSREVMDAILLRIPLFGRLMLIACCARWNRTLGTLSQSGVPIVEALDSVSGLAGLKKYQEATQQVRNMVNTGIRISEGLDSTHVFPAEMTQMIRIGEESGRLDHMLNRLAEQYETQLDDMVDNLSTFLEPTIMSVIGILVGVLIVGMYMPIFNMGAIL